MCSRVLISSAGLRKDEEGKRAREQQQPCPYACVVSLLGKGQWSCVGGPIEIIADGAASNGELTLSWSAVARARRFHRRVAAVPAVNFTAPARVQRFLCSLPSLSLSASPSLSSAEVLIKHAAPRPPLRG